MTAVALRARDAPPAPAPRDQADAFEDAMLAARPPRPGGPRPADGAPGTPRDPRQLGLDLFQGALDLLDLVDPTPISGVFNTVVSIFRQDWAGALVNLVGSLPVLGDSIKMARLNGMADLLEDALRFMARHPGQAPGADAVRRAVNSPLFTRLLDAFEQGLRQPDLPGPVRDVLGRIVEALRRLRE